jgi:NDP-sugar pyrophosphorylase family protein
MPRMPDALILCGGAGLRLRSVIADTPKSLAGIGGRPFLELLLKQLRRNGFERVILAAGYRGQVIREYFGSRAFGVDLEYSFESTPLGTGGALRNAASLVTSDPVLIMNGDSYTEANIGQFVTSHLALGAEVTMVVVPADGRDDCGTVVVDASSQIRGFQEKLGGHEGHYINAGIYLMSLGILFEVPEGRVSLEKELFPQWIRERRDIRAIICPGICVDIGTPERYWIAQERLRCAEANGDAPREQIERQQC